MHYQTLRFAKAVTTGNIHNTQPVEQLAQGLTDKLHGDKGPRLFE
jgi:hypothetical protein